MKQGQPVALRTPQYDTCAWACIRVRSALRPTRSQTYPTSLPPRSEAGLEGWKPPESAQVRGSLAGYWRAAKGLSSRARTANELALLHVPQEGVTALRAMAAGEPAGG